MLNLRIVVCALLVVTGVSVAVRSSAAKTASDRRTTWDGVFSDEQAQRGRERFLDECSSCHRENLGGDGMAPGLKGDDFLGRWERKTIDSLLARARTTMPPDSPGKLGTGEYLDIIAFLLQANGFPVGKAELQSGDRLGQIDVLRDKP